MDCNTVCIGDVSSYRKATVRPISGTTYYCYSLPAFDNNRTPEKLDGADILSNKLHVEPGDILVNKLNMRFKRVWPLGALEPNSVCSTEFVPLVPGDKIDGRYLSYVLISDRFTNQLAGMRTGTSGSHQRVKPEWILEYSFPLPDMDTQRKIGSVLGSIDQKIELNNRLNGYLAGIATAIFNRWLQDASDDYASIAQIASLNPETYSPTKEKWPIVQYLDTGGITRGAIDGYKSIRVDLEKLPSRARRKIQPGDIIYSTVRPNQEHYGIVLDPDDNVLVSTGFTVVRSTDERVCPEMLYLFLTQAKLTKALQQIAEQSVSTYPSIKAEDIGALKMPLPTQEEADWLKETLRTPFEMMETSRQENLKLAALRNALLPKLISGEIDVSGVLPSE